jgi:F0F1-type ATP synthase membrane subunit c/vacuolar-type H+-ATPase subunit K
LAFGLVAGPGRGILIGLGVLGLGLGSAGIVGVLGFVGAGATVEFDISFNTSIIIFFTFIEYIYLY